MNRLRCPKCASLRISGNQVRFKCKACGFIHDSNPIKVLKRDPFGPHNVKNGMIFRENLDALVVKKRRGKFVNPLNNPFRKSEYKTVIYK